MEEQGSEENLEVGPKSRIHGKTPRDQVAFRDEGFRQDEWIFCPVDRDRLRRITVGEYVFGAEKIEIDMDP